MNKNRKATHKLASGIVKIAKKSVELPKKLNEKAVKRNATAASLFLTSLVGMFVYAFIASRETVWEFFGGMVDIPLLGLTFRMLHLAGPYFLYGCAVVCGITAASSLLLVLGLNNKFSQGLLDTINNK